MIKHIILLLAATVLGVVFRVELLRILDWLLYLHNELANYLALIFSSDHIGRMIQGIVALLLIPAVVGGFIAGMYSLLTRKAYPYTWTVIWVSWVILFVTMLVQMSYTGSIGPQGSHYASLMIVYG